MYIYLNTFSYIIISMIIIIITTYTFYLRIPHKIIMVEVTNLNKSSTCLAYIKYNHIFFNAWSDKKMSFYKERKEILNW